MFINDTSTRTDIYVSKKVIINQSGELKLLDQLVQVIDSANDGYGGVISRFYSQDDRYE